MPQRQDRGLSYSLALMFSLSPVRDQRGRASIRGFQKWRRGPVDALSNTHPGPSGGLLSERDPAGNSKALQARGSCRRYSGVRRRDPQLNRVKSTLYGKSDLPDLRALTE